MAKLSDWRGIRPIDVVITAVVIAAVELNVATSTGPAQIPLDAVSYAFGAVTALPILARRRWPLGVLLACSLLLLIFYSVHRRDISPVPLLAFPLYDAATAGYLAWATVIPAGYMTIGIALALLSTKRGVATIAASFLPSIALLAVAVVLGDTVRSRRALAAETAEKLRLAEVERAAEAGRAVAEERLRIARELHDTVAHAMATITVLAGSALHLSSDGKARAPQDGRDTLTAIRQTSKAALADMRVTLSALRAGGDVAHEQIRLAGLDRLDMLVEAARAAGAPVTVSIDGDRAPMPGPVDHAAYRILQESLTNVLRHAGQDASATVALTYAPEALTIRVTDDGVGVPGAFGADDTQTGHGLTGMRERAVAVGGEVRAGPMRDGGFEVLARLPLAGSAGGKR
ncbi:MAG TPA: sensor histidine kinase [Streptosporangiaceae bacterium]|nr:sensor histidine kinase [Streptosporangiaceae bacterium]